MNVQKTKGVGTAIREMLSGLGIHESPACRCKELALKWDENGLEWCKNNVDVMVDDLISNVKDIQTPDSILVSTIVKSTRTLLGEWTARKAVRFMIQKAIKHVES